MVQVQESKHIAIYADLKRLDLREKKKIATVKHSVIQRMINNLHATTNMRYEAYHTLNYSEVTRIK
ncbi:MAG: hypothetical protein SNH27_07425 [Rikenellaceae bacterium]